MFFIPIIIGTSSLCVLTIALMAIVPDEPLIRTKIVLLLFVALSAIGIAFLWRVASVPAGIGVTFGVTFMILINWGKIHHL